MYSVSLVIPTYNEEKNITLLVEEIFSYVDKNIIDLELIIVDDNSPDGTAGVADELSNKFPIKVIKRAGKMGLGSAVREGFRSTNRPYLGVMDADLSHDPLILNELIKSLNDSDIAIGSRFEKGSTVENWALDRKMLSRVGVWFARKLTKCNDPLSGYFFLRRSVIDSVPLQTEGYKILFEILVKGNYKKIKEVPFNFRMRKFSTSKLNYKEYLLFLSQILSYGWYKFKK